MAAEPNIAGMARLLYIVAGAAVASWGLWGADQGWTQWTWLVLGGVRPGSGPDRLLSAARIVAEERIESELNAFPARRRRIFSLL